MSISVQKVKHRRKLENNMKKNFIISVSVFTLVLIGAIFYYLQRPFPVEMRQHAKWCKANRKRLYEGIYMRPWTKKFPATVTVETLKMLEEKGLILGVRHCESGGKWTVFNKKSTDSLPDMLIRCSEHGDCTYDDIQIFARSNCFFIFFFKLICCFNF